MGWKWGASTISRLREKIGRSRSLGTEMRRLADVEAQMLESPDQQVSLTDPDARPEEPMTLWALV
jgi:hypothetical protein